MAVGRAVVTEALLTEIDADASLRNLTDCFGESASRAPPRPEAVLRARRRVGRALNLPAEQVDAHGPDCKWRYHLVAAIQKMSEDPDEELPTWLRDGAPMGLRRPLRAGGGIFPPKVSAKTLDPDEVLRRPPMGNHPSFKDRQGCSEPPGHTVVQTHVDSGFALIFRTRADAEVYLDSRVVSAPLGTISKIKDGGAMKHRVIMDLKANGVNDASETPERQVLPTLFQHALDVAALGTLADVTGNLDAGLSFMILDLKDAFMSIGLDPPERVFNTCCVDRDIVRRRPRGYPDEPDRRRFLVWTVLGFGGKPNPLVFARAASFATRSAQAMLRTTPSSAGCRRAGVTLMQCYVDDPIAATYGTTAERAMAVDLVIAFWLVLGIDLAWKKRGWAHDQHR